MPEGITPSDIHKFHRLLESMDTFSPPEPTAPTTQPGLEAYAPYLLAAAVVWILGIVYCERAAEELFWNRWIGRLIGVLFPILGPLVLLLLNIRQRHLHYED